MEAEQELVERVQLEAPLPLELETDLRFAPFEERPRLRLWHRTWPLVLRATSTICLPGVKHWCDA